MRHLSRAYRASVGSVLACGLAVGLATPSSAMSRLVGLKLNAPYVTVSFLDTEPQDKSNVLVLRPQGGGETLRVILADEIPGVGRTVVRRLDAGIRPDTAYCAAVEVAVPAAPEPSALPSGSATPTAEPDEVGTVYETGTVCADPPGSASVPGGPEGR
ncbi:hypothetical protein ACIRBY_23725 [Streptomyces sp. NPDC096136]|uniref:hypothetical protein n=1 Tax=Streptomyces sp. NPDC096136 TaxID=3366076 RepID=UPI00380478EB